MKMSKVFPSRYVKAAELNGKRVTVTIRNLVMEEMTLPGKKPEKQPVLYFQNATKGLVLNKSNSDVISSFYGDESDFWGGKQITLYPTTITAFGEEHEVIRVAKKIPSPGTNPPTQTSTRTNDLEDEGGDEETFGDETFGEEEDDLWASGGDDARPVHGQDEDFYPAPAARPVNNSDGPCPECHAPVGKLHANGCTAVGASPAARPAAPNLGVDTRPVAQTNPVLDGDPTTELYVELAAMYDSSLPLDKNTTGLIRKLRNADTDSVTKITDTYLKALIAMLKQSIFVESDDEAYMLLTALLGYRVSAKIKPGQLVHGFLIKPLRDEDAKFMEGLMEVLNIVREFNQAVAEETT